MYISIANSIYSSTLQGSGGGFPKASFVLDFDTIADDFTFTRNSFATRVNENGLIETVTDLGSDLVENGNFDELGSELVTNGDFENGSTDWTENANWSIADGKATSNGSSGNLQQGNVLTANEINTYLVAFDIVEYNSGNVRPNIHGNVSGTPRSAVGTYSEYITGISSANTSLFMMSSSFNGSIDNVSVKQVDPNDDWILDANWIISNGRLSHTAGSGDMSYQELVGITSGKTYILNYNVSGRTVGQFNVRMNATVIDSAVQTNGDRSITFLSNGNNRLIFAATNLFDGSIDNVSVQEILEDDVPRIDYTSSTFDVPVLGSELITNGNFATDSNWSKQSGWIIANGVATFDINNYSGGNANIYQNCMVSGKEYVLTYDVVDYVQGYVRNVSRSGAIPRTANGTYTEQFVANNGNLFLKADPNSNTILSIDNVSVKEVTAYTTTDKGAFLLEPISTNLAIYSEDASQGILSNCTVQSGFISPEGNSTAYKLIEDSSNSIKLFRAVNNSASTINTSYSSSIFVKKGERTKVRVYGYHLVNQYFYVDYDLTDNSYLGSFGSNSQVDGYAIEDIGDNGWKKITITGQKAATYSWDVGVSPLNDNGDVSYLGDGVSGLYIWGAQMEELPYASSYIPTSGTTVTRAQETCLDGVVSANSLEGVLYWEGSSDFDSTTIIAELSQGDITNRVSLYYQNGIDSRSSIRVNNVQNNLQGGGSLSSTKKLAIVWSNNIASFWVNGSQVDTDTYVGSIPEGVLTALNFAQVGGAAPFYGRTKDLRIYDKALTDAQLIELTTI